MEVLSRHIFALTAIARTKRDHSYATGVASVFWALADSELCNILETCDRECNTTPERALEHIEVAFRDLHDIAAQLLPASSTTISFSLVSAVTDVVWSELMQTHAHASLIKKTTDYDVLAEKRIQLTATLHTPISATISWPDAIKMMRDVQSIMRAYSPNVY
jgi:hypothetical protein